MKWTIGWGAVPSCNMRCEFCYSKNVRQEEKCLELRDWKKFLELNHEYIDNLNYGTGESSISDEWFDLIFFIAERYPEIKQALTSNGYISQVMAKYPDKRNKFLSSITEVDISLDFKDQERHNNFRGQKNAYDWAISAIDMCKEQGIEVTLVFIGTNETMELENLEGLFKIAMRYDIKLRMNLFRPTNGINAKNKKYIASFEKILEALNWINNNHTVLAIDDALFSALLVGGQKLTEYQNSLRILPDGSITPSTYLISSEFRKYKITDGRILQNLEPSNMGIDYMLPDNCKDCIYKDNCGGGVYDRRYLWYGTFTEKDPYCPFRYKRKIPEFKINQSKYSKVSSIHHGYLPTMFFEC
jgi:radical SAM protein with 4Fe4S-binding SPASM domain